MRKIALLVACTVVVLSSLTSSNVAAQTLRFDTNVGSFNMVLNPTNNPALQDHVDNLLGYVALGRFHFSAINRAPEDFVIQMGGFSAFPGSSDAFAQLFQSIGSFAPVIVDADNDGTIDFDRTGLSNTIGTVSLALSNSSNSGTSSFFINLDDNSFLDDSANGSDFVPFAEIQAIDSLDPIRDLEQVDLSSQLGSPGSLAFSNIPIIDGDEFVVVRDVVIVDMPDDFSMVRAIQRALGLEVGMTTSATISTPTTSPVPEPACICLALLAGAGLALSRRRAV